MAAGLRRAGALRAAMLLAPWVAMADAAADEHAVQKLAVDVRARRDAAAYVPVVQKQTRAREQAAASWSDMWRGRAAARGLRMLASEGQALPNKTCPVLGFVHPAFGVETDDWVRLNEPMLKAVASRGVIVVVSQDIENDGLAPRKGYPLAWYENIGAHMAEALYAVAETPTTAVSAPTAGWEPLCLPDPSRVVVAGWSVGAALAALIASNETSGLDVRAVVSIAPTIGVAESEGGNGGKEQLLEAAPAIGVPLVLLHGTKDELTDPDSIDGLYANTAGPVLDITLDGANHCFIYLPFAADCGTSLPPAPPPRTFLSQSAAMLEVLLAVVRAHASRPGRPDSAAVRYLWRGGLELAALDGGVGGLGARLAGVRRARHAALADNEGAATGEKRG